MQSSHLIAPPDATDDITHATSVLACPTCRTPLQLVETPDGPLLACDHCQRQFGRSALGCWDFLHDNHYADFFSRDQQALDQYVEVDARGEEIGSRRQVVEYIVPLMQRLGLLPGEATVFSNGCGIAVDVEELRARGYDTWGGDPGARSEAWSKRSCRPYLIHCNGTELPFVSNTFDFVFSEGVIEHVGQSGDFLDAATDFDRQHLQQERRAFCQETYRVLRPNGYALMVAPNRWFPIDFFHGGNTYLGMQMRFHSPREHFLAAAADFRRWFAPHPVEIRAVSLQNFFNLSAVEQRGPLGKAASMLWRSSLTVVPPRVVSTVGPYFAVIIRKQAS
jgi:SAM-dependent methyltransferase